MEHTLLRHYLATLAYRTTHAVQHAPDMYPSLQIGNGVRSPIEIINHMTMLMTYTISCFQEVDRSRTEIGSWDLEKKRFFDTLTVLDEVLAKGSQPTGKTVEQLLQGPLADAMTHVGQLMTLRRVAGSPVEYENYMKAEIQVGHFTNT